MAETTTPGRIAPRSADAVTHLAYSSITAFLAHYKALGVAARHGRGHLLSTEEHETLTAMETLIAALKPEERVLVLAGEKNPEQRHIGNEQDRRRARAEFKLRQLLQLRGVLPN